MKQVRIIDFAQFKSYIFNNHDQEWEFYTKRFLGVHRCRYETCAHIGSHDFEHAGLNICICDSFDVSVSDWSLISEIVMKDQL